MKLVHLSIASIAGCLLGLLVLMGITLQSMERMQAKQMEIADLFKLQERIDDFSAASDSLLLLGADPGLWQAYRDEARDIQRQLQQLGLTNPDANKAAHRIEVIMDAVEAATTKFIGGGESQQHGLEPLDVPPRSRIIMNQIASHGVALDTALDDVLRERQQAIARQGTWIAGGLAASTLLFGVLCVVAFIVIHRRVTSPTRALMNTLESIRAGDLNARAPIIGNDELTELARTLNHMLDESQASDIRLHQYRTIVEGIDDMCGIADANYRYLLVNRAYASMFGLEPLQIEGRYLWEILGKDYFEHDTKPRVDCCLAGEAQRYETERDHAGKGRRQILVRYYPITMPDEETSHVCAVITDITELKKAETQLREQTQLLDMAGRVGRLGGWSIDLLLGRVSWSDMVAEIHAMPHGYSPTIDEGIDFYAPEYRERIRTLFTACAEEGVPYDDELQIIDANGQRIWVRAVGEAVRNENGEIVKVQGAFQDISASMASKQEIKRLAQSLQTTLESITDAFFILDRDWRFHYLNSEAGRLLRRSKQDLLGKTVWNEFYDALGTAFEQEYRRAMAERVTVAFEEYYPPLETWFDVRAYPSEEGLAIYFRDVTERHTMMERLLEHEKNLRRSRDQLAELLETRKALINSLPAHIALLDGEGTIVDVNEQWRHFGAENAYRGSNFGLGENYIAICDNARGDCAKEAVAVAQGLRDVLAGRQDNFILEYPCHSPEQFRWFRVMVNRLISDEKYANHHGAAVMHVDITERKLAEQELNRLAYQDSLTGLLSRNGFTQILSERLAHRGWQPADMVIMLDILGQRDINDAHGYDTGDQLLIRLGQRLQDQVGQDGQVGRVGGDEFVLFLPSIENAPEQRLRALSTALQKPFEFHRVLIEISVRIGYSLTGDQPRPIENLLREAELALFQNRVEMTPSWIAYTHELDHQVHQRIQLTHELRIALDKEQFELHFQPKVDLETGRLLACEGLLRWNHPERGLQPPGLFIPIAEQSQLIGPIGDWVLREACRQLREWQETGLEVVCVAVNVSLVQFIVGDFPKKVRDTLREFKIAPDALSLEITESVFERESDKLLRQIKELHEIGVRLSLDDFGTGYSSLLYLQKYPFDEIKIDRGFVRHILDDPYSREIVKTVMGLAGALGADVVAEGIESDAVRTVLLGMGCRIGQGFYYSVPLETEDFRWLLEKRATLPLTGTGLS